MRELLNKRKQYRKYLEQYVAGKLSINELNRLIDVEGLDRNELYKSGREIFELYNILGFKMEHYIELGFDPRTEKDMNKGVEKVMRSTYLKGKKK